MNSIALVSNLLGSAFFLILTALLLINWQRQLLGGLLILASAVSILWFSAIAYNAAGGAIALAWIKILETLRGAAWLSFLFCILKQRPQDTLSTRFRYLVPAVISGLTLTVLVVTLFISGSGSINVGNFSNFSVTYTALLLMALLGLLLVEQIYVHTLPRARWSIKFLCLGVGGFFIYDFFLYSEALLFNRINPDIWFVRGAINAMCVPLIAVSVARNPQWQMDIFVSRHIVYQSTATTIAGAYLVLMAIGGYYIRLYGGTWGSALQILFVFGGCLFLVIFTASEQLRTRLKVFLAEHFYKNKYDYRQEWLNITRVLSENKNESTIYKSIVRAVADTMKCEGGALWLAEEDGVFRKTESISYYEKTEDNLSLSQDFIDQVTSGNSVINLAALSEQGETLAADYMPESLINCSNLWLLIGLVNDSKLTGFVLLTRPHAETSFSNEDEDLLKTVGNQIASYIALLKATESLAQARQFEAFNRISAFVVHDIKNLVAQLSLINTNAKRFGDHPEFLEDVFATIENSVNKMNRLLTNLRKGEILGAQANENINVYTVLEEIAKLRANENPVPVVKLEDNSMQLKTEKDKLLSVLEHIVQNAQEATAEDGSVELDASSNGNEVNITVSDTGAGMTDDFIRNRLFKPFHTTKGNAGMGIGVYESREVIHALGGRIKVSSEPGKGTVFTIVLPLSERETMELQRTG